MLGLGLGITEISTLLLQEQAATVFIYVPEWNFVNEVGTGTYTDEAGQNNYIPEWNYVDESGTSNYTTEG